MKLFANRKIFLSIERGVLCFLLIVGILLVGGSWVYLERKNKLRMDAENSLTAIARLKVNQIISWRSELLVDASILIEDDCFSESAINLMNSHNKDDENSVRARLQILSNKHHYLNAMLVDNEGSTRFSLKESDGAEHLKLQTCLKQSFMKKQAILSDLNKSPLHPLPHFLVVAPFFKRNSATNLPVGAVVLECDAEAFLYPLIKSWPVPSRSAETLLVRQDGKFALFLNNLRNHADAALNLKIPLTRTDVPAVMAILGKTGLVEGIDYRGARVISVIMPIEGSSWFMISKIDAEEALEIMHRESVFVLFAVCGLVILAGTIGVAIWQLNQKRLYRLMYKREAEHGIILNSIGDGVIVSDMLGKVRMLNSAAEILTGWACDEAKGRHLEEIFRILDQSTYKKVENLVSKVVDPEIVSTQIVNHSILISRNDARLPIVYIGSPINDEDRKAIGIVLIFHDQTKEHLASIQMKFRLVVSEYATKHNLDEILTFCLDEISTLSSSQVAFFHLVENDSKNLLLQQWSTSTQNEFCKVDGKKMHQNVDQAGVWADCIKQKKPIIHNDFEALANKKGFPSGHTAIVRELIVPILREGKIEAVLGVGNKTTDYTESDVSMVSYLADLTLEIVRQQMAKSENDRLRTAIEQAGESIIITDREATIQYVNPAFEKITGYTKEEVLGMNPSILKSDRQDIHFYEKMFSTLTKGKMWHGRLVNKRKDGSFFTEDATISPILDASGKITNYVGVKHDISESLKVEAQLLQAQKLESLGRLAGGVAHDYNNMLGVILGFSDLAMEKLAPSEPIYNDLREIHSAAVRSTEITRQLLAFARKQTIAPVPLDINEAVERMLKMLRRLIGENVDLVWIPKKNVGHVMMDPSQVDQILANLCVNARDAIEGVGKITIETHAATYDDTYCSDHPGFIPGDYVTLIVSDDGCGMDMKTIDKIFEPFYTTKELGRGTGLGLATVYGIVKQNNGFIYVYSEPGKGSSFKIYLARQNGQIIESSKNGIEALPLGSGEIILVVEDEISILNYLKRILDELGYTVLTAIGPMQALQLVNEQSKKIDLLITDVVLPEMNGRELSCKLQDIYPELKIIFMSGYTEDVIVHHGVLDKDVHFIQKPFSKRNMAIKISMALA